MNRKGEQTFQTYDGETLKRLQAVQVEILSDFIKICDKYHLDYFMLGGTGIGVVRHQGFIPWDDDIDVAIPRRDYNTFLSVVEKEMGDKYQILTPLVDGRYACNVTHLQKKGTRFVPENSRNMKCELCIDIDLFPMDHIPDDPRKRNRQLRKIWFLSKLLYLCGTPSPIIPLKGVKKGVAKGICAGTHYVLKALRISPRAIYKKLVKVQTRYNDQPCRYINPTEVTMADRAYISKAEMYPLKEMPFENITVKMPNQYDNYLRRLFGDYMTMPPEEERVNHCPYILDFGEETCKR